MSSLKQPQMPQQSAVVEEYGLIHKGRFHRQRERVESNVGFEEGLIVCRRLHL